MITDPVFLPVSDSATGHPAGIWPSCMISQQRRPRSCSSVLPVNRVVAALQLRIRYSGSRIMMQSWMASKVAAHSTAAVRSVFSMPLRLVMSMPETTRYVRPSITIVVPVREYSLPSPPERGTRRASVVANPACGASARAAAKPARSSGWTISAAFPPRGPAAPLPQIASSALFQRTRRPCSSWTKNAPCMALIAVSVNSFSAAKLRSALLARTPSAPIPQMPMTQISRCESCDIRRSPAMCSR